MSCEMLIRRYINSLPPTQIFTTGEVLNTGERASVDSALRKLVNDGEIHRLTRGMFVRDRTVKPSVFEIAWIKARRFGRIIVRDSDYLLRKLELQSHTGELPPFASNGRSTSFRYGVTVVKFKGVSDRKILLGESRIAQTVRAVWYAGNKVCNHRCKKDCENDCQKRRVQKTVERISDSLGPQQLKWLNSRATWFPAWIGDLFSRMFESRFQTEAGMSDQATATASAHAPTSKWAIGLGTILSAKRSIAKLPNKQRQHASTLETNPLLKGWLRTFPLDRRIIRKHPTKTLLLLLDDADLNGKSRRYRESEEIASRYPDLAPRKFFIKTEDLKRAIKALALRVKAARSDFNSRAGPPI